MGSSSSKVNNKELYFHENTYNVVQNMLTQTDVKVESKVTGVNKSSIDGINFSGNENTNANIKITSELMNKVKQLVEMKSIIDGVMKSGLSAEEKIDALMGMQTGMETNGTRLIGADSHTSNSTIEQHIKNNFNIEMAQKILTTYNFILNTLAVNEATIGMINITNNKNSNFKLEKADAMKNEINNSLVSEVVTSQLEEQGIDAKSIERMQSESESMAKKTSNLDEVSGDVAQTVQKISDDVSKTVQSGLNYGKIAIIGAVIVVVIIVLVIGGIFIARAMAKNRGQQQMPMQMPMQGMQSMPMQPQHMGYEQQPAMGYDGRSSAMGYDDTYGIDELYEENYYDGRTNPMPYYRGGVQYLDSQVYFTGGQTEYETINDLVEVVEPVKVNSLNQIVTFSNKVLTDLNRYASSLPGTTKKVKINLVDKYGNEVYYEVGTNEFKNIDDIIINTKAEETKPEEMKGGFSVNPKVINSIIKHGKKGIKKGAQFLSKHKGDIKRIGKKGIDYAKKHKDEIKKYGKKAVKGIEKYVDRYADYEEEEEDYEEDDLRDLDRTPVRRYDY